ncbi:MAG: hypothetical protein R2747_13730 [Pyrinomonadaceae bacterium]
MRYLCALLILLTSTLFIACGTGEQPKPANGTNTPANKTESPKPVEKSAVDDSKLSTPQGSIEYQLELIKAGDFDKLKECLTERVRGDLTKEIVDKAKADASKHTMDDLFASSEEGEKDGKKTATVMMKNGKSLTTLIETNGKWLADTIWFK